MPEDESLRLHRKKTGGNKRQRYTEGWVEFTDKKMARMVAEALNGQKMGRCRLTQWPRRGASEAKTLDPQVAAEVQVGGPHGKARV